MYPLSYTEPWCLKQSSGHNEAGYVEFILLRERHPDSELLSAQ